MVLKLAILKWLEWVVKLLKHEFLEKEDATQTTFDLKSLRNQKKKNMRISRLSLSRPIAIEYCSFEDSYGPSP